MQPLHAQSDYSYGALRAFYVLIINKCFRFQKYKFLQICSRHIRMQYGHKLVVFATKKFVIPLLLSPKVNTAQKICNIIHKILFSPQKMVLEYDGKGGGFKRYWVFLQ